MCPMGDRSIRPPHEPLSVLLAEDDCEMRRLLAHALRRDGHRVVEAKDGSELLAFVKHAQYFGGETRLPNLIVSDIRMPGWSGLEVLAALRRIEPCVPVVLITAFGGPDVHAEAEKLGAAGVLDKPFDLADLRRVVLELTGPAG
jgi:CheY-like chemotaxis protein